MATRGAPSRFADETAKARESSYTLCFGARHMQEQYMTSSQMAPLVEKVMALSSIGITAGRRPV
jgi:hypothetical protein